MSMILCSFLELLSSTFSKLINVNVTHIYKAETFLLLSGASCWIALAQLNKEGAL